MERKEVFILGSGFSKAIHSDMPLLNDLTKLVTGRIEAEDGIFKNIYERYMSVPSKRISSCQCKSGLGKG